MNLGRYFPLRNDRIVSAPEGFVESLPGTDFYAVNDLKNTKKWIGDPLRNSLSILDKKYVVLLGNGSINKVFKQYIKPFNCKIISFNSN